MTRFATLLVLLLGAAPAAFAQLDVSWDSDSNTLTIGGTDGTDIVQGECTSGGVVTLSGQPTPAPCLDVETIEADLGDGDDGLILTGFGEFVALKKLDVDLGAGDDFGDVTGPLTFQAELSYTIDLGPGTDTWSFDDPILDDGTVTVEVDSGESGETEDEVTTAFGGEPELWLVAPDGPLVILDDPDGEARVEFHFPDTSMMPPGLTFNEGAADGALYGGDLSGATMLPHELSFTPGSSGGTVDLDETVLPEDADTRIRVILGPDGGEVWTTPYGDFIVAEYGASGVIVLPADPVIEVGAWLYLLGDDASLETVLHVLLDYLTPSAPGGRASLRGDDHLDVVWLNSGGGLSIYNYPGLDQLDAQPAEVFEVDLAPLLA